MIVYLLIGWWRSIVKSFANLSILFRRSSGSMPYDSRTLDAIMGFFYWKLDHIKKHVNLINFEFSKKRFTRTFYDFSLRQLKFQDFKYVSRICDLELRFMVEHMEHEEYFELNRYKDTDSHEYFFVRRVMVVFLCRINELLDWYLILHFNKYRNKLKLIFTYFLNRKDWGKYCAG